MSEICPRCKTKIKYGMICPSCRYNLMFMPCYCCGNMVSIAAPQCMKCGTPIPKRSTGSALIDVFGILIIIYAIIASTINQRFYSFSFVMMSILLVVAWRRYKRFSDMPIYDITQAKNTLIAVVVVFILMFFGFGVVII